MEHGVRNDSLNKIWLSVRSLSGAVKPIKIIDEVANRLRHEIDASENLESCFEEFFDGRSEHDGDDQAVAIALRLRCLQLSGESDFFCHPCAKALLCCRGSDLLYFMLRNVLLAAWRGGHYRYCFDYFSALIPLVSNGHEGRLALLWNLNVFVCSVLRETGRLHDSLYYSKRGAKISFYLEDDYKIEYGYLIQSVISDGLRNESPEGLTQGLALLAKVRNCHLDLINRTLMTISFARGAIRNGNLREAQQGIEFVSEQLPDLPPGIHIALSLEKARFEAAAGFTRHAIGRLEDAAWGLDWCPDGHLQVHYSEVFCELRETMKLPVELVPKVVVVSPIQLYYASSFDVTFRALWEEWSLV